MSTEHATVSESAVGSEPLDEYRAGPAGDAYDEVVDPRGAVRPSWRALASDLATAGTGGLAALERRIGQLVDNEGITYTAVGGRPDDPAAPPSPWRLDAVPLLLSATEWDALAAGLEQRSLLLDAILADIYGPMRLIESGRIPPELVFGHAGYLRAAHDITIRGRHQLFMHGCDVSRWPDGRFRVYADRAQAPSGAGYAIADRQVITRAAPAALQQAGPRPLAPFARALRLMLLEAAPSDAEEPVVVVLSPGTLSETAFDQAYLASLLGFPLVESADLVVRDGRLWMRSLGTLRRVDVVLRRVDAEFSDPLDLRPDSRLGVVGLVEALRRGTVAVVNTLGSGVLENPGLTGLLPDLCRDLLDADLQLESVASYWAGIDAQRSHVLANLPRLIIRSATDDRSWTGAECTAAELDELRARIEAEPWKWVGQEPPHYSLAPAVDQTGRLTAAPVGMRLFSLMRRSGYTPLLGGLGWQFDPAAGSELVAAKDVWVRVADADVVRVDGQARLESLPVFRAASTEVVSSPRVLGDLFWMGRYSERAEATVRLLSAVRERYQDYRYRPWLEGSDAVPVLMGAVGRLTGTVAPADAAGGRSDAAFAELSSLTVDKSRVGSAAYAVDRYGYAARAVRDQLSGDTWMVLGTMDRELSGYRAEPTEGGLATVQSAILVGMLSLSGLSAESMVHDSGWHVMDIGKRLERSLALIALLRASITTALPEPVERRVTESVLLATESAVTYRRRNRGRIRTAALVQLLLFDAGNPRSLVFQLEALAANLRALPGASGSSRPDRLVGGALARLRRVDPAGLEPADDAGRHVDLIELLDGEEADLRTVAEVFEAAVLSGPGDIQPLWAGTRVVS
ncbi:circularly permuted type 2 ATP-grasp protein [Skermania piniformis]|uniref:Circularly permuted type 2 ATP-grasp protein n=1 Tax=Skermania pinensis TaxID=39122 RepID=A0ABX8S8G3_9ACTN|nr:circularly permuted type 2 ATP-grasp protein [Skermania piniformis]QXQ14153.1 circularly permuted type 2 ATP-grasp protein [Skermania piniformis]